jgi:RNA polymerase sigma factor (sigma-70 family)
MSHTPKWRNFAPTQGRDEPHPTSVFERFLREQRAALVGFLRRRMPTRQDAEDGVQESFTRLLRYRDSEPAEWKPLLYRIATNVARDQARLASARRLAPSEEFAAAVLDLPSDEPSAELQLDQQNELAAIREAILALPPRCREVFLLNRIEGMSFVKIARHLNISTTAVEKHIAKALLTLNLRLGKGISGPL